MMQSKAFKACLLLSLSSLSHSYIIDASCNQYSTVIQGGLTSAFSMATDAHTALTTDPLGPNVAALAGYLFGTAPYTKATQVFNDITNNLNTGLSSDKTDPKQVIIYCDFSRLQPRENDRRLWDPDTEQVVVVNGDYDKCNSKTAISKSPAAYTTGNVDAGTIQQIQLCPWYIASVSSSKRRLLKDFNLKGLASRIAAAGQKILGSTTAMDDTCGFDCTMLHELSHTRDGGKTNFGDNPPDTYEWKAITALLSQENADSIAYFGLGVAQINAGNIPQADGSLQAAPAP